MKAQKILKLFLLTALAILLFTSKTAAQESSYAPTELSREINGIKVLIEDYKNLQGSFEEELRDNATELQRLNRQMSNLNSDSEKYKELQLEYRYVYATALRSRIDQLQQLRDITKGIEDGVERAMDIGMETGGAATEIISAIERLTEMSEEAEQDKINTSVLAQYIHDLGEQNQTHLDGRIEQTDNNLAAIEKEKNRLSEMREQLESSPNAENQIFSSLNHVKQSVGLASTKIAATLTRLETTRKILLEGTDIMIEFNNINEMTSNFNQLLASIRNVQDITDVIDDEISMPSSVVFPLLPIETMETGSSPGSSGRIDYGKIQEAAKSKYKTVTEN